MLGVEFHPLAARELDESVAHFESLYPGKGLELARDVRAAVDRVRAHPESAPISQGAIRSVIV